MATIKPKISLYVPQSIYDRFNQFKDEQGMSMTQAGVVIFAEYFGLEETLKNVTEGMPVGGVTIQRLEAIEQQIKELQELLQSKELEEDEEELTKIPCPGFISQKILAQRLGLNDSQVITNLLTYDDADKFMTWTRKKDPNGIGWEATDVDKELAFTPIIKSLEEHSIIRTWLAKLTATKNN